MARTFVYKQEKKVLKHMQEHDGITSMDAFHQYSITRLSAKIFNLRKAGYPIKTYDETYKNEDGDSVTYARYRLEYENNEG